MMTTANLEQLQELATAALGNWGIQGSTLELLKHRENAVYGVTTAAGERFALRVHRKDYHTDDEFARRVAVDAGA